MTLSISNHEVADVLERVADLLEAQHASSFRVRAYRRGAETCRTLEQPLSEVSKLEDLPNIGKSIASAITEYLHNGRLMLLERLEGQVSPEALFATIPAIGEELAHRIHEHLHIETLEQLEIAAHDGRLATVPGFGTRRIHAIRDSLEVMLRRSSRRRARAGGEPELPSIEAILEVDAEYRTRAEEGSLRKIAPRRFNPSGESWLPILHTDRQGWHFTALFSNSARAHALDKCRDWVVIFYERDGHENQCTVISGPEGQRIVRGRQS
ncbi:MAG: helix-hairpin-helix domain-containing protein [Planctomycetota bacterium]|jgi:DNA polymerase/3'-5' exonuclease PolX